MKQKRRITNLLVLAVFLASVTALVWASQITSASVAELKSGLALLWNPCIPDCGIKAGDSTWCDLLVSAGEWGGVDVYSNGTSMDNACSDYYGLKFQCVELVQRFYWEKRGHDTGTDSPHWGINYAYQAWNTHPASLVQRPNEGGFTPEWGDILVWRNEGPYPYGHVAIVTGASADTVYFVQQNIPGKPRSSRSISNGRIQDDYLYGWLHYSGGPSPTPPTLLSPANGAWFESGSNITLSWTGAGDSFFAEYWGAGSGTRDWSSDTSWSLGALSNGAYYWHVKARNSYGESYWSETGGSPLPLKNLRHQAVSPTIPTTLAGPTKMEMSG